MGKVQLSKHRTNLNLLGPFSRNSMASRILVTQSWLEETAERFTNQVVTDHTQLPPFFANLKADFSKWLAYIVT